MIDDRFQYDPHFMFGMRAFNFAFVDRVQQGLQSFVVPVFADIREPIANTLMQDRAHIAES